MQNIMAAERNLELALGIMVVVVSHLSKDSEILHACRVLTRPQTCHELLLVYNNCVSRNTIIVLMYHRHNLSDISSNVLRIVNPVIVQNPDNIFDQ
jgi:hypothetical protein